MSWYSHEREHHADTGDTPWSAYLRPRNLRAEIMMDDLEKIFNNQHRLTETEKTYLAALAKRLG